VKIGAIGDVVMALPMLDHLKKEGAHVTWVVGEQPAPLLQSIGLVDELIMVDEQKLLKGNLLHQLPQLFKLWRRLGRRFFDQVLTAHVDWRYRLLALFVRASERKSFSRGRKRPFPVPGRYHAHEYMRLATGQEGATTPFATFGIVAEASSDLIILAPGGAKNVLADSYLRRWPIEHYVHLAHLLSEEGYRIGLTGNESDLWILSHFQDLVFENFVGKKDLVELMHLLRASRLLITHDSGPLHVAKLAGCPVLALFGPTNPYERVSHQERIKVLWGGEHLPCRPCYDGKRYALCDKPHCLESITPEKVFEEAQKILHFQF
jgi:ADP-heptose:LPS heptosyltransferase